MNEHSSVLLNESIDALAIDSSGIYVDGTYGRGGHSQVILSKLGEMGRLIVIDKDEEACAHAKRLFADDKRITIVHSSYAAIYDVLKPMGLVGKVNGILLDLGVSSPQLDDATRGFSFMHDGPLDMRMDKTQAIDAAYFVNHADVEEMSRIFKEYGEERFAKRIAKAIEKARKDKLIQTTGELAQIIRDAHPRWEKHKHPATRVFQAIRIHINQELDDLRCGLMQSLDSLSVGGRLVVISFHSLEDRIVKRFMRSQEKGVEFPLGLPIPHTDCQGMLKRIGKAIKPSESEVKNNVRARSAVLRVGEKNHE